MILFGSIALDILAIFTFLFLALYYYATRKFNFFKELGVTYIKPIPFIGSLKDVVLQRLSIGNQLKVLYDQYKHEPYIGIFSFDEPALVVNDLNLIKNIMVKDAQNFTDRLIAMDETKDPLISKGLFMMKGQKWRHMRINLSPTFTSGKMKNMFYLVDKCAKEFDNYLDEHAKEGAPIEIKDASARFTTDVIASCAFGIDSNSLKNPEAVFRQQLRKVFHMTPVRSFAFFLSFFSPSILKKLRLRTVDSSVNSFVKDTLWSTAKYREEQGISRRDFLECLMDLKKKTAEQNGTANHTQDNEKQIFKFSDDYYAAQALTFLTAGFETSSSTISFTLYQLAMHTELQQKLRNEILEVLEKHKNEVTYDGMQEMKYLDMVINETLRLYPILPFLDRMSRDDYDFPAPSGKGTVRIPAGMPIYIPLLGIQKDPEYFPDPEKYDPERFTEENKKTRPAYTHMPFGEGPRICIGMRFGLMQTKTGLIHILSRYEVSPCKETPIPLVLDEKNFLVGTASGIPLSFKKIHA